MRSCGHAAGARALVVVLHVAADQVQLEGGCLIFAPADDDQPVVLAQAGRADGGELDEVVVRVALDHRDPLDPTLHDPLHEGLLPLAPHRALGRGQGVRAAWAPPTGLAG